MAELNLSSSYWSWGEPPCKPTIVQKPPFLVNKNDRGLPAVIAI